MDDTCSLDNVGATAPKKTLLFEDEQFKLTDSLARRIVFRPLPPEPLFSSSREPHRIQCLNLTREHFKPGATKFRDLTPEAFNLLAIWFNALAFAFDKKRRLSTTPQQKKLSSSRQQRQQQQAADGAAVVDHDGALNVAGNAQSEEVAQEKEGNFINGAGQLTVFLETLLETDPSAFRVGGFRLWVLDASNDRSGMDLLTKGVRETLLESANIQKDVQFKLAQITAKQQQSVGAARKGHKTYELHNRYRYTDITTEAMLINAVGKYFAMDGLLSQAAASADAEANGDAMDVATPAHEGRFIDRRAFMDHNRDGAGDWRPVLRERINTMHTFFGKEQAMVYHVEKDCIQARQRTMACYFGHELNSDDIAEALESRQMEAKNPERLCQMLAEEVADRQFRQFPYPSITYQVDPDYLSFDVFADMPLPHRLGTYLYTTLDLDIVCSRINAAPARDAGKRSVKSTAKKNKKPRDLFGFNKKTRKSDEDSADDDEGAPHAAPAVELPEHIKPLGLYDVELEVTSSLMHIHDHYLTETMRKALQRLNGATAVPRHVRECFVSLITSDIRKGLMAITNQVDKAKPYITEASHNRDAAKHADLPYLEVATRDGTVPPFRATSCAHQLRNRDKRHLIDRRVYSVIGSDNDAVSRERHKNLSTGNEAYFRSIIAQRRPVDATVESALACQGATTYDRLFLERDIYLILDVLNRFGYAQIDREFFDPRTNQVRKGQMQRYVAARRAFTEAIIVEFYGEFFTSAKVSLANVGIRNDLIGIHQGVKDTSQRRVGMRMPLSKFNMQVRPYHAYKQWVYSYFVEHDAVNHNYKTSDILFHARYHHCRAYPPHCKDPKMNVLLSGQGTAGKSHKLGATKDACPSGVAEGITHMTNQAMNVDQNMNDMLIINEEMSNKLISPSGGKGGAAGTSEAANDDARNNFKERSTAGVTVTLAFYQDEETGERKARISKCQCQNVILGATNNDLSDSDPNVMSRFIIISVPRSNNQVIGNRPQDKNRLEMAKDETKHSYLQEQVREVHRVYYMVECMVKAGILGNTSFGVAIDGAQLYMMRILDMLQAKYGIATNDIRKRKHVIEMARCKCISYACWYGLTSPLTRHLQYDVYTGEFIGFNPRVLLDGIMPYLVVTKDHVIDAISALSCLWGHEYMDQILKQLATSMCQLDKLRESDFVRRPRSELEGPGSATMATSALTTRVDPSNKQKNRNKGRLPGGFGAAPQQDVDPDDDLVIDWNYISVTSKTHGDIHNLLSNSLGELCVAPNDIAKVLRDLGRTYIQTPGYMMGTNEDGDPKLVKSDNPLHNIPRRIVAYGGSAVNGLPTIAISVAFLKQKLPHLLPDSQIEDLVQYTSFSGRPESAEERAEEDAQVVQELLEQQEAHATKGDALLHHDDEEGDDEAELLRLDEEAAAESVHSKTLVAKMMDAITLRPGSVGETSVMKAIRDVLENAVLELNPDEDPAQEEANFADYRDVHTGQVPWLTYATSEHPQPLLIGALFPDLRERYSKVHGHNKEILLSDKIAVLQLKRKRNGEPLVYYNYNTIAASSDAALPSLFTSEAVAYPELREGETDPHAILEVQELEAIRAEFAMFEQVHKNRFRQFANHAVAVIDCDLDYSSCADHLLNIGYPVRHGATRLVNYPPHMYMNLVDFRSKLKNAAPLVPLYRDVQERISKTRQIIESQCGLLDTSKVPTFRAMMYSNFDQQDLRDSPYANNTSAGRAFPPVTRRRLEHRVHEKRQALRSVRDVNEWHDAMALGDIASASHNMTTGRAAKKARHS
jgi:hypothetical protein